MNILLITIDYPPEIRSVANMCRELADDLTARGHTVTVLTTWPRYNLQDGVTSGQFKEDMQEGKVRVIRVKTLPLHKVNYAIRGLAQITLPILLARALRRLVREKMEAVIVYSPPLALARVGVMVKKQQGARFLLNVQDVFPQNAIDLGILRNRFAIAYLERIEKRAYRDADAITTCTEGARQFLTDKKGVAPGKVTAVYNWVDTHLHESTRPTGIFRTRFGLEGKMIILFAGILGPSQGLDFAIEVARKLIDISDLVFLILGDGTEKQKLQAMVSKYNLTNVQFGDFISLADYGALLKEVDVGLMTLKVDCKTPTIPGKFFGFAASSLPVLAFLNKESEGHRVIAQGHCGYAIVPEDPQEGATLVRRMYADRRGLVALGKNGYNYVNANFSKAVCIGNIEQLLHHV